MRKEFSIFLVHQHGRHFIVLYTNMPVVMSCETIYKFTAIPVT